MKEDQSCFCGLQLVIVPLFQGIYDVRWGRMGMAVYYLFVYKNGRIIQLLLTKREGTIPVTYLRGC